MHPGDVAEEGPNRTRHAWPADHPQARSAPPWPSPHRETVHGAAGSQLDSPACSGESQEIASCSAGWGMQTRDVGTVQMRSAVRCDYFRLHAPQLGGEQLLTG